MRRERESRTRAGGRATRPVSQRSLCAKIGSRQHKAFHPSCTVYCYPMVKNKRKAAAVVAEPDGKRKVVPCQGPPVPMVKPSEKLLPLRTKPERPLCYGQQYACKTPAGSGSGGSGQRVAAAAAAPARTNTSSKMPLDGSLAPGWHITSRSKQEHPTAWRFSSSAGLRRSSRSSWTRTASARTSTRTRLPSSRQMRTASRISSSWGPRRRSRLASRIMM